MQFLSVFLLMATSAMALPGYTREQIEHMRLFPYDKKPPVPETCMQKSAQVKEWVIKNFKYEAVYTHNTPEKQTNTSTVTFTLHNNGAHYEASCKAESTKAEGDFFHGDVDYNCDVPLDVDSASFRYNRKSGFISVFQHWACEKENGWFEAKGNTTFTTNCKEKEWKHPYYKAGDKIYSSRRVTCEKKELKVPIYEIQGVL